MYSLIIIENFTTGSINLNADLDIRRTYKISCQCLNKGKQQAYISEVHLHLESCQISMMELFVKISHGQKLLAIFEKKPSILDDLQGHKYLDHVHIRKIRPSKFRHNLECYISLWISINSVENNVIKLMYPDNQIKFHQIQPDETIQRHGQDPGKQLRWRALQ